MSGALTTLVAVGKEDAILHNDPQITFFKTNFKRYANFSQATLSQVISGNPAEGALSSMTISKKGDLMNYMYITKKINGVLQPNITEDDIEYIEFVIGEQIIDKITTKQLVSLKNIKNKYSKTHNGFERNGKLGFYDQYNYPLGFWFCDNWSCSIPLVSLQYHDVQVRIRWGASASGATYEGWVNYVYLDKGERQMMSESKGVNDMLIYQHAETPPSNTNNMELTFNNPVSFLFSDIGTKDIFGKTIPNVSDKLLIRLNGVDIVDKKEITPHYNIMTLINHTEFSKWNAVDPINKVELTRDAADRLTDVTVTTETGTNMGFFYPFALNCSSFQPSGTCNFSRIDGAYLISDSSIKKSIYARNYNVLRIQKGMGGMLFNS